ncbi:MAG: MATE family efflux transporter [Desulfuromonadales bacterium]|nr:MATE family efflux transporter [Desulfuromonadales bacterium]
MGLFAKAQGLLLRIPPHLYVAGSAWVSRVVTAATGIFMIRILTQSLGTQQYAAYAIFGGLMGWYSLTDMGIGSSLQNHISERRAKGERYDQFIATSAVLGLLFFFFFVAVLVLSSGLLSSLVLRKFDLFTYDQKSLYFLIFGVMSIAASIGGISYRIWFAEQKGYLANLSPACAALVSFLLVIAVSLSTKANSLFWMILAGFGPTAALPVLAFVVQVARKTTALFTYDVAVVRPLLIRGLKFWLTGLLASGVLQVDYLVMSQYLPPHDIVTYNLSSKIFLLLFFVYSSLLTAIWPLCAEAAASNDWDTLMKHVHKSIVIGFVLVGTGTAGFIVFRTQIIGLLSPKEVIDVPVGLILLFGLYYLLRVWCDVFGMILQSMSYLRPFVIYIPVQAALSIGIQILLTKEIGLKGVLIGLITSFILAPVWILPWVVMKKKKLQ